ncbi:MAG: hypothetical protein ACXVB0_19100 [Mucilaginibacter sp.]
MENTTQTTKITKALDKELKALLKNDLKNFKSMQNKTSGQVGKQLLAA